MRESYNRQRHAIWRKGISISFFLPFFVLLTTVIATLLLSPAAEAATSSTLNFSGRLATSAGGTVPDGSYNMQFNLYTVSSGGTSEWTETRLNSASQGVTVRNGYFSVYLGEITSFPSNINWDQEHWLGMTVRGSGSCSFGACTPGDSEMTPRFKLSAVPYAFRAGAVTDSAGNAYTGDDLIQKSPSSIQTVNSALSAIRLNQAGAGGLLQLQDNGTDVFIVQKNGATTLGAGITVGNSNSTTAGTIRWSGSDLEVYDGSGWVSLTIGSGGGGGGNANTTINYTSGAANVAGTATARATGLLSFTSATAVSNTAGSNTFVAPADGSFRSCLLVGNANRTGGTVTLRWRVNGVSVGAGACIINATNNRASASTIDPGVVPFNAGDTITVVLDSAGLTPAGSIDYTVYWTVEYESSAVSNYFAQGGNDFGGLAQLGTTSAHGMNIITNGATAISISAAGDVGISDSLTIGSGLTVSGGGLSLSGGLDNNNGGITEAGSISGVNSLAGGAGLTIQSGGAGNLTLNSASGLLVLGAGTLQRSAAGSTTIDLLDSGADTVLVLTNSDGTRVAGLSVEGGVSATSFNGSGSGLTDLDGSAITSGTISDSRLSSNVALLNANQTFSGENTFSSGLVLGNSGSSTAGAIRWTGTDFEGFDGLTWLSLTNSGPANPSQSVTVVKTANEIVNNSITLQDDDELTFQIGANETWAFRFVLQGNSGTAPDFRFAVTAPSGATCRVGFSDPEGATSNGQYGCGVSSATVPGNGAVDVYEIMGTVTNGGTPGNVTLQWAQFTLAASNTTIFAGSYLLATSGDEPIAGNDFSQGGNSFGATAILGTTDNFGLNFITNGNSVLTIDTAGVASFVNSISGGGDLSVTGIISGASILGDGSALTDLDASNITTGTISDARLSSNVALLSGSQMFTGMKTFGAGLTLTTGQTVTINGVSFDNLLGSGLVNDGGALSVDATSATGFFRNGGNSFSGLAIIGTTDNEDLSFITNNTARGRFTNSGELVIGGAAARNGEMVDINGTLRSNRYILGTGPDLSLIPVAGGQSVASSWWGLQLVGNRQASVDYTPANIGAAGAFSVAIPNQQAASVGLLIRGQTGQSANLLQLNDVSGNVLSAFDSNGQLVLGRGSGLSGVLTFNNSTNANTAAINSSAVTGNRTASLPDASGTICLSNSDLCGYIRLASGSVQTDASNNDVLAVNKTSATGNLINLQRSGGAVFTVANTGALQIQSTSSTALDIRNTGGTTYFSVDSSTGTVRVGSATADALGVLFVLDTKNTDGDPAGIVGAQYFNSARGTFRCYEDGRGWTDCNGIAKPNTRRSTHLIATGTTTTFDTHGDIATNTGTTTAVAASLTAAGALNFATANGANNDAGVSGNLNYNSSADPGYQSYVVLPTIVNTRIWAGLTTQTLAQMGASANPAGSYAAFRYDTGAGDATTWRCVTRNGTTQTINNSGVTVSTNTVYRLEIIVVSGTRVEFKINGVLVCTNTTNLPAANVLMRYNNSRRNLATGVQNLRVSWIYIDSDQ